MSNKQLLQTYAQTGAILPEYQMQRLSSNILKTYLRRRVLQAEQSSVYQLLPYELQTHLKIDKLGGIKYLEGQGALDTEEQDILNQHKGGQIYQKWLQELKKVDYMGRLSLITYLGLTPETFNILKDLPGHHETLFGYQRGKKLRKLLDYPSTKEQRYEYLEKALETYWVLPQEWQLVDHEFLRKHIRTAARVVEITTNPQKISQQILYMAVKEAGLPIFYPPTFKWPPTILEHILHWLLENDPLRLKKKDIKHMTSQLQERYLEKWIEMTPTRKHWQNLDKDDQLEPLLYKARPDLYKIWLQHSDNLK